MIDYLNTFINQLDSFDWLDLASTHLKIEKLLHHINVNRCSFKESLSNVSLSELKRRADLSHETPSHYKWHVHKNLNLGYSIWMHEYKARSTRRPSYVEIPHNHRYWFTSLILAGEFQHQIYDVNYLKQDNFYKGIKLMDNSRFDRGRVYTMSPQTVHSIDNVVQNTLTLVVRSIGVNPYSESFDLESKQITKHTPFSSRLDNMASIIDLI
jgi:hypothetical protein